MCPSIKHEKGVIKQDAIMEKCPNDFPHHGKDSQMKKQISSSILLLLLFTFILPSCSNAPTPGLSVTNTPDPCAPENIEAEVQKVHKLMREFDDGSALAASVPADQLTNVITNLQRVRRDAEDLVMPPCLVTLKTYEINHMNIVIDTLINLIGYANGTVTKDVIDKGVELARQEHDKYTIELARVLGLTPTSADTSSTSTPAQ